MAQQDNHQPTAQEIELLAEVSQLLTVVDLERVLQQVIALSGRVVGASKTSLFLHEGGQIDWEHLVTMRNLAPDESVKVVTRVLDEGFAGWVYRHKRGDIIKDTAQDERWLVFPDDPVTTHSALCVPFLYDDDVIAVLTLVHEEAGHFKTHHLRLLTIIANQAAIAIRNAQLFNHLNQQRQQLHAVLQSIHDVLLVLDASGHIMLVNEAALSLLDAALPQTVITRHIDEFIMVDDALLPIVEIIRAALPNGHHWRFETRSERRQTDYQVTISLWEEPLREDYGYVIVMHNVTTLHDLARFKDEMLRVASHDLRGPLALIAGYADMVSMDTADPTSPVHDYVKIIRGAVEKMGTLVEDLLRVERIRTSPLELQEQTDLSALVRVVLVNLRPAAQAKHLHFESKLDLQQLPRVMVDSVLMRQAMENLIYNAIKYTPGGGKISIFAHYDDDKFHFMVEDTGIGIPDEHQPYVFESFYRVNNSESKGSGLGLSLVRNVVARHDGEVWVKSRVNEGSRFGFWIPLRRFRAVQH